MVQQTRASMTSTSPPHLEWVPTLFVARSRNSAFSDGLGGFSAYRVLVNGGIAIANGTDLGANGLQRERHPPGSLSSAVV
ncbi:hypothetical protein CC2G_015026 [Coprinopsis cinerea AmutBmut pab1-1]|nr:hypothetical protein CC2G_015026 [Coprinopsis cinerea AmutBmut pab1-1]